MENVGLALTTEHERVPDRIADERSGAAPTAEVTCRDADVVPPFELTQETLEVARGAGARLREHGRIDCGSNHSASA